MTAGRLFARTAPVLLALIVSPILAAAQTENSVDVGGHKLYYQLHGRGTPTVVVDVGVGESIQPWLPIAALLSKSASVLLYERAGYGRSGMGPLPRDAKAEAADLKALLGKAGIKGPYILVGHSLGGMNMQVFAREYPEGLAGWVLLDPPPRGWLVGKDFPALKELFLRMTGDMEKSAAAAEKSGNEGERRQAPFLKTIASEHREMFGSSARSLLAVDSFGALPVVVIASGRPNPQFGAEADAYQKFWIEENRKLARLSTAGEFVLAERSTHQIHRDAPDVVLAAIRKLIAGAGERAAIERAIRDCIGWAKNKDFKVLYGAIAGDADFLEVQPDGKVVKGIEEFKKAESLWRNPDFKAVRYEIHDLKIKLSKSGDVAWFFCILDDVNEWKGKPASWENTRWTGVLEKRAGRWVMAQQHFSFARDK